MVFADLMKISPRLNQIKLLCLFLFYQNINESNKSFFANGYRQVFIHLP